jgi:hypothetical protein
MSRIPKDKLRALKKRAKATGRLPSQQDGGVSPARRRALRRDIRTAAREAGVTRKRIEFSYEVGDLVRIRSTSWPVPTMWVGSVVMVMDTRPGQLLLAIPDGSMSWLPGSNVRPAGLMDDDDEEELEDE